MALRVSYKNRIGYYTKTEKWPDEPERKFKNWMCHANVDLWADMPPYNPYNNFMGFYSPEEFEDTFNQCLTHFIDSKDYWIKFF